MQHCGVEMLKDGTEICSLHEQPLEDLSALDEVKNGEYKPMVTTLFCTVGNEQFTAPFTLTKFCLNYRLMLHHEHAAWRAKDAQTRADVKRQMREHLRSCTVCQIAYRLPI